MTSESGIELLPCPFCGWEARIVSGGPGNHFVQCLGCRATSDDMALDRAISNWNRRHPPASREEGLRVKPIEWVTNGGSSVWSGELIFHTYYVIYDEGNGHRAFRKQLLSEADEVEIAYHPELDAAKSAAQEDYQNRVLSAIETSLIPTKPEAKEPHWAARNEPDYADPARPPGTYATESKKPE